MVYNRTCTCFFDDTTEANLGIEALYSPRTDLVIMFEKNAQRHAQMR